MSKATDPKTVDCRGLACPQPVERTKEALEGAASPFLVIVDNEESCFNVTRFAESQGARVSVARESGDFHLTVEPGRGATNPGTPPVVCSTAGARRTVVFVSSEGMGRGDEALGAILMTAFLDTLSHFGDEISHVIFVNAGAKLTVEGSAVLDQIRQLEQMGIRVQVCGTCLNHFGIRDRLAVGSVTTMYAIIETLSRAGRIIRP